MDRNKRNLVFLALLAASPLAGCSGDETLNTPSPGEETNTLAVTEPQETEAPTATAADTSVETETEAPEVTDPPVVTEPPTAIPTPTDVPAPSFFLDRTDPDTGSWAYNNTRYFFVYFNEPFPASGSPDSDVSLEFTSSTGDKVSAVASGVLEGGLGMQFTVNLVADTDYSFEAKVADGVPVVSGVYSGSLTTATPCGVGFDLASKEEGRDLTFEQFGSAKQVSLASLNAGINGVPQDLVTIFDGIMSTDTLPASGFQAVAGSIVPVTSNAGSLDAQEGLSGSFDNCNVDAGGVVSCTGSLVILPINTGATERKQLADMYVRVPVVSGNITVTETGWNMTTLNLRGLLTASDLTYFLANAGPAVETVLSPIADNSFDATYNGEDALNVEISALPVPFALDGCDASGL